MKEKPEPIEYETHKLDARVVSFFNKRGISAETLQKFRIGYEQGKGDKPGSIMFPRFMGGECVAIKHRTHDKRMWQSKNPEPCFFNYDMANTVTEKTLIITEGEIDAMSVYEAGFPNVVSVPDGAPPVGANNLENKFKFLNYGLISKFDNFILAVDNDEPGKNLERELSERLEKYKCLMVSYPSGCKDINDVLIHGGVDAVKQTITEAKPYPVDGLYTGCDMSIQVFDFYEKGFKKGHLTGWETLDDYYTVRPGEMTIVTGMPGSGKSTWLDALMVNLFKTQKWKTAFCSPENWPIKRHMASIIEKIIGKPFDQSTSTCNRMNVKECLRGLEMLDGYFYFTEPPEEKMTIKGILGIMQEAISRHGVNGVVLDPWNELEAHRPTDKSETEYVSESLGKIRRFARSNNVHVWVVAHPTKMRRQDNGQYPVPRMYDIAGSAHFYNKTDNGISIHRPDIKYALVDVNIQKIRFKEIGKLGTVRLKYLGDSGTYESLSAVETEMYEEKINNSKDPF